MNKEAFKNDRFIRSCYYRYKSIVSRKALKTAAEKCLEHFGRCFETSEDKNRLIADMISVYGAYGFAFDEYLLYDFENKSKEERVQFVADWEHLGYACVLNCPRNNIIFDNKNKTYERFQKYYKRKLLLFERPEQYFEFEEFVLQHPTYILKPLDMSCGNGIMIDKSSDHENLKQWFEELLLKYNGRFIVEELIIQADAMAKLHSSSVNTIRVPTIRLDEEVLIVNPFLRVGQGGRCVDNAGAGGIICALDGESGVVFATADEHGNRFTEHPQTHVRLIDFKIPRWDEAKAFVSELAKVVPDNRYTGWDIALTEDGWVLVEANRRGQFVWQIASQVGFRKEIDSILHRMGKKY